MKTVFYSFLLFLMIITSSCEKEALFLISNKLVGTWTETTDYSPQGLVTNELTINEDFTFLSGGKSFGIYKEQNDEDLSAWFEFTGNIEQGEKKLVFSTKTYTWWDSFHEMMPKTEDLVQIIFEDCTYEITENTLELIYTTYPLGAPLETKRKYTRIE